MRGIDTLLTESDGSLSQPLPGFSKVLRKVLREGLFRRAPAIVSGARLDPLLAVIALTAIHVSL